MFQAFRRALAKLGADIARESAAWKIRCMACGRQRSLASVGGIRYGGLGASYTLGSCSKCAALRTMRIYKPLPGSPKPGDDLSLSA